MPISRWILLLALLLVGISGSAPAGDEQPADPKVLPVAEFDLADFKDSVVLVDFWASWCEPCHQALPWLNDMQEKYEEQGLQIVMVNLDRDPKAPAKMMSEIDARIRNYLDPEGELAARYELEGMPSSFLFDRSGKLLSSHVGFLKAEGPKREKALVAALENEAK